MKNKLKSIFEKLFPSYETSKQGFWQLPFPLLFKCLIIYLCGIIMFVISIIISISSDRPKAIIAGFMLTLVFVGIGIWHSYLFTRKKYVRVFAYVARREKSRHGLKRETSTFIIFPDASEREIYLGKKKLNIGSEYAFYFGQKNGTIEPNCHIIYGYEPATQADEQIKLNTKIANELETKKNTIIEFPAKKD